MSINNAHFVFLKLEGSNMVITKDVPVPTSYRKLHSINKFGVPLHVCIIWGGLAFSYLIILLLFFNIFNDINRLINYMMPVTLIYIIIGVFMKDEKTISITKHAIIMYGRMALGKNIQKKHKTGLAELKKIWPIESVEKNGMIIYQDLTAAFLLKLQSPRRTEQEMDIYNEKMMTLVNSLYGGYTIYFFPISVNERSKTLETVTLNQMNSQDKTPKQLDHLKSMYDHAVNIADPIISWNEYVILTVPKHESIDETMKAGNEFMKGLSAQFYQMGTIVNVLNNEYIIVDTLRTLENPLRLH